MAVITLLGMEPNAIKEEFLKLTRDGNIVFRPDILEFKNDKNTDNLQDTLRDNHQRKMLMSDYVYVVDESFDNDIDEDINWCLDNNIQVKYKNGDSRCEYECRDGRKLDSRQSDYVIAKVISDTYKSLGSQIEWILEHDSTGGIENLREFCMNHRNVSHIIEKQVKDLTKKEILLMLIKWFINETSFNNADPTMLILHLPDEDLVDEFIRRWKDSESKVNISINPFVMGKEDKVNEDTGR